jgi:hypothetical protein
MEDFAAVGSGADCWSTTIDISSRFGGEKVSCICYTFAGFLGLSIGLIRSKLLSWMTFSRSDTLNFCIIGGGDSAATMALSTRAAGSSLGTGEP